VAHDSAGDVRLGWRLPMLRWAAAAGGAAGYGNSPRARVGRGIGGSGVVRQSGVAEWRGGGVRACPGWDLTGNGSLFLALSRSLRQCSVLTHSRVSRPLRQCSVLTHSRGQASLGGGRVLLVVAVVAALYAHRVAASPFGEKLAAKLAAAQHVGSVATSAATTAEMKQHAVSPHSDSGKREGKPSAKTFGLQAMPGMAGLLPGADGGSGGSTLDENDPAAALTKIIAPEDVPKTNENGTIIEDSGVIGADGKRQGQLAPPPDFTFPIVLASITGVAMVVYFSYECCFKKEEKRKKGDSYM
jgi:hypothetical protein